MSGDKITDFAIDKLSKLLDAAEHALPHAVNVVLSVTQINCMTSAMIWLVFLLVWVCLCIGSVWVFRWSIREHEEVPMVFMAFVLIIGLICLLFSFDVWDFIGMSRPDLYIVHSIVQKATA